jgi:ComF family protein
MRRLIASAATRCPRCGSPQVSPLLCGNCDAWEVAFERAVVLAPYADPWAQAIQALKFGGRRSLGPLLGRFMARQLAAELAAVEALVPVPLYPARQRERGFNQSRLIATGLAGELGVPVLDGLLVRRLPTRQQARLGAVARRDNLVEAIACGRAPPRDLTLCLVDDVMTTGATLDACALALRRAGARPVVAATLAAAYG